MTNITRGGLSKRTGCHIETIRYYEKTGLMPNPPRSPGGHRMYGDEHLRRLSFIRRARELGFGIEDVRGLLELVDGGAYSCAEIQALTLDHVGRIKRKMLALKTLVQGGDVQVIIADGRVEQPIRDALAGKGTVIQ